MIVDFPHPVGPTIAIRCPDLTSRLKFRISFTLGSYEKKTLEKLSVPSQEVNISLSESSAISSSSRILNTLSADETAF